MKKLAIFASWNLCRCQGEYYISGTHYTYLQFASANFDKIYVISSTKDVTDVGKMHCLSSLHNIEVVPLPFVGSFVGAYRNFRSYIKVLNYVKDKVDTIYCRVPDPFCWIPAFKFKQTVIMHYVGDTIDATLHNEKWAWWRKLIMIGGYLPDYALTLLASRKAKVYTNGTHIHASLKSKRIKSTALISSTVGRNDILPPPDFEGVVPPRMIYVGYLRFAKGMHLLKQLWLRLQREMPDFRFHLVGNGEMALDIDSFIVENGLKDNVICHGRIDDREELKRLLRSSDLFVFPSLSEGSPRVVIEAMAEGLPVISTPVGSLPGTFTDGDTIRYFGFDNDLEAFNLIQEYCIEPQKFRRMRDRAYMEVCDKYTKETFLSQIYGLIDEK